MDEGVRGRRESLEEITMSKQIEDFYEIAVQSNYNFGWEDLPLEHAHYEYSFHYGDTPDGLDRSEREIIGSQGRGYMTIFRIKTSQDLLLSHASVQSFLKVLFPQRAYP